jgi:hypothetical protein
VYNPTAGSWTDVSDVGMYYWTKDIVVDPNDVSQNTWYVCVFSGWGGAPNGLGGLYKTTNRGGTWTKLTGTTIDRVTSITFNPSNPNQIFLTTEGQGLWMCNNINAAIPAFNMVFSYPFQQPERVFFNPYVPSEMWVTSFGNGMKVGSLLTTGIVEFTDENSFEIYPNPSSGLITMSNITTTNIIVYNSIGQQVFSKKLLNDEKELNLSFLDNGIYFLMNGNKKTKLILSK